MSVTRGRSRTDPNEDSASSSPRTGSAHSTQSGGGPSIAVKKTKQRKFIFKQYGDFIVHSSSTDNTINIYQLENPDERGDDSTGSEPERTGRPIPGSSAFRRPNLGADVQLRLINSWHLEGVKKIKFNRGLVFCLTTQLEAWHLWVTRVSLSEAQNRHFRLLPPPYLVSAKRKTALAFRGHTDDVTDFCITSSEDGVLRVITSSMDKTVRIWDVVGHNEVRAVHSFNTGRPVTKVRCVGNKIATAFGGGETKADILMNVFGTIQLWDMTGAPLSVISGGHNGAILGTHVGPLRRDNSLITWSRDGQVMIWKLDSSKGRELRANLPIDNHSLLRFTCGDTKHPSSLVIFSRKTKTLFVLPLSSSSSSTGLQASAERSQADAMKRKTMTDVDQLRPAKKGDSDLFKFENVTAFARWKTNLFYAVMDDIYSRVFRVNTSKRTEFQPIEIPGVVEAICPVVRFKDREKSERHLLVSMHNEKDIRVLPWPGKTASASEAN